MCFFIKGRKDSFLLKLLNFGADTEEKAVITKAEIIYQPSSGQYKERIYDITSSWNSQNWTWVKFEEDFNVDKKQMKPWLEKW